MFKKSFRYSFTQGIPKNSLSTPLFTLRYQANTYSHPRVAVVVSKKVEKKATGRNRIRRKFLHNIELIFDKKEISFDMIFYVRNSGISSSGIQIKESIENALKKTGIIE